MSEKLVPMVESCDLQVSAVTSTQDALLERLKSLQDELMAFMSSNDGLAPTFKEKAEKLHLTEKKLARVNERLRTVQKRLFLVSKTIQ